MRLVPSSVLAGLCALLLLPACFDDTSGDDDGATGTGDGGTSGDGDDGATTGGDGGTTGGGTDGGGSSTGDGGDDGGTSGTGTGTGTGAEPASCEEYCSFMEACDADFPQYSTVGPCLSVCENIPLGTKDDQTGNTVGCRTFYAIQAGEGTADQEAFCHNAGPAGNGVCGGMCESFCAIQDKACTGDNKVFDSILDCTNACMGWDMTTPYQSDVPEADTYACRLKHLTYATIDPDTHCSHVQDQSPVCA